ncbi:MAG: hypothetical protein ABFD91_09590 [Anaerohalosphaeraceae bacterium]
MKIAETIRKEIKCSGKTRAQISRESRVSEAQLHRLMEKGKTLSAETFEVLLEYFGYELHKAKGGKR